MNQATKTANFDFSAFSFTNQGELVPGIEISSVTNSFMLRSCRVVVDHRMPCNMIGGHVRKAGTKVFTTKSGNKMIALTAPTKTNSLQLLLRVDMTQQVDEERGRNEVVQGAFGTADEVYVANPQQGLYSFTEKQYLHILCADGTAKLIYVSNGKLQEAKLNAIDSVKLRMKLANEWFEGKEPTALFLTGIVDLLSIFVDNDEAREVLADYLHLNATLLSAGDRMRCVVELEGKDPQRALYIKYAEKSTDATPSSERKGPPAAYLRKKAARSALSRKEREDRKTTTGGGSKKK